MISYIKIILICTIHFITSQKLKQKLKNFHNTQYHGSLYVGGQPMTAIYDTGSFEVLVLSKLCDKCEARRSTIPNAPKILYYDHDKSCKYKAVDGKVASHVFGSGPVESICAFDQVSIFADFADGKEDFDSLKCSEKSLIQQKIYRHSQDVGKMLTVPHQSIWEISSHNIAVLDNGEFNAIVGIGPFNAPEGEDPTLLQNLNIQKFSVCLLNEPNADGYITWNEDFHHKDETNLLKKKENTFLYKVPVIGEHHWAVNLANFETVSKKSKHQVSVSTCNKDSATSCVTIFDSGTSLIAAPKNALLQLSEAVGDIAEDCSNINELPDLVFYLGKGEAKITLPPTVYVLQVEESIMPKTSSLLQMSHDDYFFAKMEKLFLGKSSFLQFENHRETKKACLPAFMEMNKNSTKNAQVFIFGMPVFRHYHTTFVRDSSEIILSLANDECEPSGSDISVLQKSKKNRGNGEIIIKDFDISNVLSHPFARNSDEHRVEV